MLLVCEVYLGHVVDEFYDCQCSLAAAYNCIS